MPKGVALESLPSRWDWREIGKVTAVKDQGNCGACYAFAAIANIESKMLIESAGTFDFSENNAKECNWEERNNYIDQWGDDWGGCDGGNAFMLANLFSQKGTVLESCDPYADSDVQCKTTCPYQKTLLDWRIVNGNVLPNPDVLKAYIQTYGPVYTSMYAGDGDAWENEFGRRYDGSYTLYYPGTERANHAVLIIGWDDNLVHAGGTGGWIVKNSWGTGWGGTCGYGSEQGYFTIAYGSASIGMYGTFVYEWQDYDASGGLMYYDDAGATAGYGYRLSSTAWGLCRFFPASNTSVTRVEFWTLDTTTDVDVYLYDDFDLQTETLSNLQRTISNLSYNEAGYHSVEVNPPLPVTASDDIVVVVKFTNSSYTYPIAVDSRGPAESQRTYMSSSGLNGSWYDLGTAENVDVAIRLRTSGVGATATPTRTSSPTPTDTLTPTPTDALTSTATPTHTLTPTPRGYGVFLPIMLRGYPIPTPPPTTYS